MKFSGGGSVGIAPALIQLEVIFRKNVKAKVQYNSEYIQYGS